MILAIPLGIGGQMKLGNLDLLRYLEISEQIRQLELEKEVIKLALKEKGSFETDQFRVLVSEYQMTYCTDIHGLIEKFGKRALGKLVKEKDCVKVTVSEI